MTRRSPRSFLRFPAERSAGLALLGAACLLGGCPSPSSNQGPSQGAAAPSNAPPAVARTLSQPADAGPAKAEVKAAAAAAASAGSTAAPTVEEATAFIDKVDAELKSLWGHRDRISWVNQNFITSDTDQLVARAEAQVMEYTAKAIKDARRFDGLKLPPEVARKFHLLKMSPTLPAPDNAKERNELAQIGAELNSAYGKGKYCSDRLKGECLDLQAISKIMAKERNWDKLLDLWKGWHLISRPMRPQYARMVELGNKGAREIGFSDLAHLWRSRYDMTPEEFEKETDRLWAQVKPLYDQLHCYVRARLGKVYGPDKVPAKGPLPAHILGNMWAQEWSNIYPLVEPYQGEKSIDVTRALQKAKYTPIQMVKLGESFFTSLGFPPLPKTFWERSLFVQPKDREVVCHASAWDVGMQNDLRIKMCINVNEEDLITIHHELGHDFYYQQYYTLPALFQDGAHDGFHEAIGDALALSVTPGYLKRIGLFKEVATGDKALINQQMKDALEKIAFLPFGKLIDQWRWDVFTGKTPKEKYNQAWWELRLKYQGIAPVGERTEADFDPGAKYHVPANVPYTRYFLARILQFQFHRAMCKLAGHEGPLHTCSIYSNKAAGERLRAMLALGSSKPWPDALEVLTGQRQMDASALVEYFQPLMTWLEQENKGQTCGW